ncbi:MAG TPA: hypothetical protein VMR02_08835, partial [Terracidiphilus sp.]|nr:hypothetical protein [Terracidiphilus sp.]
SLCGALGAVTSLTDVIGFGQSSAQKHPVWTTLSTAFKLVLDQRWKRSEYSAPSVATPIVMGQDDGISANTSMGKSMATQYHKQGSGRMTGNPEVSNFLYIGSGLPTAHQRS